jgi:Forkhead domain/FHA domain
MDEPESVLLPDSKSPARDDDALPSSLAGASLQDITMTDEPNESLTDGLTDDDENDADNFWQSYAMLKFDDCQFLMKDLTLLLGRDSDYRNAALNTITFVHPDGAADPNSDLVDWSLRDHKIATVEGSLIYEIPLRDNNQTPLVQDDPQAQSLGEILGCNIADIPFLAIHDAKWQGQQLPSGGSISRRHAVIRYNSGNEAFEIVVLGRNGLYVNDVLYKPLFPAGMNGYHPPAVTLKHKDQIMISSVKFIFNIPESDEDENRLADSVSGRISYDFNGVDLEEVSSEEDGHLAYNSHHHHSGYYATDSDDSDMMIYRQTGAQSDDDSEDEETGDSLPSDSGSNEASDEEPTVVSSRLKLRVNEPKTVKSLKHSTNKALRLQKQRKLMAKKKYSVASTKPLKSTEKEEQALNKAAVQKSKQKSENVEDQDEARAKSTEKDQSIQRINRDEPLKNGEGIEIVGLPAGMTIPARKKGPGRPPKDGVMSKREKSQLVKLYKEQQKAKELGLDISKVVVPEIKKPPRPRKNSKGEEIVEDSEGVFKDIDEQDRKKTVRPPREPSPQMREEDYTPEQLQRPQGNYVCFIYDAIMASPGKKLNLQQIYSAIERKYPYFKFKVNTPGWQSSVRHNLGQHAAFTKVEKDGKGYLWGIKPGVPIDRDRKKRSPPPQSGPYPPVQQSYPPNGYSHLPHPQPGIPGQTPSMNHQHSGTGYGITANAGRSAPVAPPSGRPPTSIHPPSNSTTHPNPSRPQSYSSPYAGPASRPTSGQPQPPYQPANTAVRNTPLQNTQNTNMAPRPTNTQNTIPRPPYNRPSEDVIDVFKSVFIKSLPNRNDQGEPPISPEAARQIVDNAVERVLDPDKMKDKPMLDSREQAVVDAFRGCIERSQPRASNNAIAFSTTSRTGINGTSAPRVASPLGNNPSASSSLQPRSNGPTMAGAVNRGNTIAPTQLRSSTSNGAATSSLAMTQAASIKPATPTATAAPTSADPSVGSRVHATTVASPKPPAVEAITPPDTTQKHSSNTANDVRSGATRKRSVSAIAEPEESAAKKAVLKDAVTSILTKDEE